MFVGKKVDVMLASIGQAIMHAKRPRVLLAPLQLGLGLQIHHQFSSRFLIDTLHAALSQESIRYIADNADHNIDTPEVLSTDGHHSHQNPSDKVL